MEDLQIVDIVNDGDSIQIQGYEITEDGIKNTVGIKSYLENMDIIEVYPNPATTHLYVKFSKGQIEDYSICNLWGQVIKRGTLHGDGVINVETLPQGVYFLKVAGKTVKIIKN